MIGAEEYHLESTSDEMAFLIDPTASLIRKHSLHAAFNPIFQSSC